MVNFQSDSNPQQRTTFTMGEGGAVVGKQLIRKQAVGSVSSTHSRDASNSTLTTESSRTDHSRGLSSCQSSVSSQRSASSQTTSTTLQWWQRCTIRQAVSFLEQDIQHVISESPFLQRHQNKEEPCALFHRSEVITGDLLGQGGFSDVYEIIGFELDDRVSSQLSIQQQLLRLQTMSDAIDPLTGRGRFVIKHLQEKLIHNQKKSQTKCKREFELAASDLVVEVAYLSAIDHPNILSIRGLPYRGIRAFNDGNYDSYFFICDRLHDTLDKRIHGQWNEVAPTIQQKANYALQLSEALQYLHKHNIIFRDLKPQNIGFSVDNHDKVLLFDFGLCRELPADMDVTDPNMMYEMSGVGTRRYMAPEIVNESRYNLKADVYSWSMVFWEMLTCVKPYAMYSFEQHRTVVCLGGERPELKREDWPRSIQNILLQSWNESVQHRLSISQVAEKLSRVLGKLDESKLEQQLENALTVARRKEAFIEFMSTSDLVAEELNANKAVYDNFFCIPHCVTTEETREMSPPTRFESSKLRFQSNPDWLASLTDEGEGSSDGEDVFEGILGEAQGNAHDICCYSEKIRSFAAFTLDDGGVEVQLESSREA
jgi:serine/threonine protein kinase